MKLPDLWVYEAACVDKYPEWFPIEDLFFKPILTHPDKVELVECLLINGLTHLRNRIKGDYRGERIYGTLVEDALVMCIKLDNNGTMLAWSDHLLSAKDIPHEYDCEWMLTDHFNNGSRVALRQCDIVEPRTKRSTCGEDIDNRMKDLEERMRLIHAKVDCMSQRTEKVASMAGVCEIRIDAIKAELEACK